MSAFPVSRQRCRHAGRERLALLLSVDLLLGLVALPGHAVAQLRRAPTVQPVAEVSRGDLLVGGGSGYAADAEFPLSALAGDLVSVARLTVAYGLASRVLVMLEGDVYRVLTVQRAGLPAIPLDPGVADGTSGDVGDFRIGTLFSPIGGREGLSGGLRMEVKLPNSDETKGIGTNTTDFRFGVLGSYGVRRLRVTADVGVGILEAPLESFEQNDVLMYSGEILLRIAAGRGRLALGVDGRASTRDRVPLGTEDLGELRFGADYRAGGWLLDAHLSLGYAGTSPDWGVSAGVARLAGP
ncbi:MAG: hypothetical protein ACE5JR_05465 [Gemmatimonadota bacterium]